MSDSATTLLSRVRLLSEPSADAYREILSASTERRAAAAHRLVWTLFADSEDRARDFLWREIEHGTFYILSARPPVDRLGLFDVDPPKPFQPVLRPGDALRFALRANATVARVAEVTIGGPRPRGTRSDVVMRALHPIDKADRALERGRVIPAAAEEWMVRQGETHGFRLADAEPTEVWEADDEANARRSVRVLSYEVVRIPRSANRKPIQLGVLEMEGLLIVKEPDRFVAALIRGFGRGKAFGCGLMLIRRAS